MARDDDRRAADLDRYWDAVMRGHAVERQAVERQTEPEAAMTALVDRLHAHVPPTSAIPRLFPNPDQSWCELRGLTADPTLGPGGATLPPAIRFNTNGRADPLPIPVVASPFSRGWASLQTAMAALLVLLLAGGYLLFWQGRMNTRVNPTWLPAAIVASLPAGYAEEILFNATFAGDRLPGVEREAIFYQLTLPPGIRLQHLSGIEMACHCYHKAVATGVGVESIQSGEYSMQFDAPFWIQRGGFRAEKQEILAQEDVTLTARDVAIFHDYAAGGEIRNAGDDPVVVTGVAIVDMVNRTDANAPLPAPPPQARGQLLANTIPSDWTSFPPGPLTATLRRVTLPAGTTLPPLQPVGLEAVRIEAGVIAWSYVASGSNATPSMWMTRYAGATMPFMTELRDVQRVLETRSDEPVVLLVLTIEPAGLWPGALGS